ncbi:MAG: 7-cyano-7-deazaguanine synthase QueC [Nitrospirales bacterium]|nr:7-cyano-7-deazaguanine synthase QueC [Nitrospirales bacterium]
MNVVVLVSGGLDSTVTGAIAKKEGHSLFLLTVQYGQRHDVEVDCAQKVAAWLHPVDHQFIHLDLGGLGGSALTTNWAVPKNRSVADRQTEIPTTYVPARNTIFLSLALAYAETLSASSIYIGANIRDYSGYPDCRPEFLNVFRELAKLGTKRGVEGHTIDICAPLLSMTKAEIIQKGLSLGVPFHLTHSCYDPNEAGKSCGTCDSCLIRLEGFRDAGIEDPIPYQQ